MEKEIDKKDDWHLKAIHLYFQDYGEHKGSYSGSIEGDMKLRLY